MNVNPPFVLPELSLPNSDGMESRDHIRELVGLSADRHKTRLAMPMARRVSISLSPATPLWLERLMRAEESALLRH